MWVISIIYVFMLDKTIKILFQVITLEEHLIALRFHDFL